ncbi:MAG: hypothetical protein ABI200_06220 [Gaiellales bacterium]
MSSTTPIGSRTPRGHLYIGAGALLALLIMLFAWTPSAHAAGTIAPNYAAAPLTQANGAALSSCRGWGGDADDAGRFYAPCLFTRPGIGPAPALVEYSSAGAVQRIGWLPAEFSFLASAPATYNVVDVAVTADGNTAYVSVGPNLDNLGPDPNVHPYTKQPLANGARPGSILRLTRQADGTWLHDPSFIAGPFKLGLNYWSARSVTVDAAGRLYTSVNAYVFELNTSTGEIASYFGDAITDGPSGRWLEGIDKAQGISVTPDGNAIYVVEQQHQLVQRWLRVNGVNWQRDTSFLLGVPDVIGDYCSVSTHFQSPYDVGQDIAGDVYVMDTTCGRVQRFTSAGAFVQTVWQDRTQPELSHGFAVSWNGSVLLPTATTVLTRLDPPAKPVVGGGAPAAAPAPVPEPPACVDLRGPKLKQVVAPTRSTTRRVTLTPLAINSCGITHVRVRGDRTGRIAWVKGSTITVPLKGWNGSKKLTVQVRDAKGRTATRRIKVTLALRQPKLVVRTRVRITGRACAANPMLRVGGAATYQLVDSCATLRGRVLKSQRAGSGSRYLVRINAATARRIYRNAVGPVSLWVITDSRTRTTGRAVRTRRNLVIVGAIVATRDRSTAFVIPVDRIAGR